MSDVTATKQTEMVRNLSDLHPPLLLWKHLKKISIFTSNGFPYGEKSTLKFVWIKTLDFVGCWYLWCTDTITIIMVIITIMITIIIIIITIAIIIIIVQMWQRGFGELMILILDRRRVCWHPNSNIVVSVWWDNPPNGLMGQARLLPWRTIILVLGKTKNWRKEFECFTVSQERITFPLFGAKKSGVTIFWKNVIPKSTGLGWSNAMHLLVWSEWCTLFEKMRFV